MPRKQFSFIRPRVELPWTPERASLAITRKKDKQIVLDALIATVKSSNDHDSEIAGHIILQNLAVIRNPDRNPEKATLASTREAFCIKRNDTDFVVDAIVRNQDPDLAGSRYQQRAESLIGALLVRAQALSNNFAVKA